MVWKINLSAQIGPMAWRWELYDDVDNSKSLYVTIGPFHIFVSR